MKFLLSLISILLPLIHVAQSSSKEELLGELSIESDKLRRCEILVKLIEAESDDNIWANYNKELKFICDEAAKESANKKQAENQYLKYTSIAYNNSGYLLYNQGNLLAALNDYLFCLSIQERINDQTGSLRTRINIGKIYADNEDFVKAKQEFKRSYNQAITLNDQFGIALYRINLGNIQLKQDSTENALENYQEALFITKEINDRATSASCYMKIGEIYRSKEAFDKAFDYFLKGLEVFTESGDQKGISSCLNFIAEIDLINGNHIEAGKKAKEALMLAKVLGYPEEIMKASKTLSEVFKATRKFPEAINMMTLYYEMKDSINNVSTKKALTKKEFEIEYEKKSLTDSIKNAEEKNILNLKMEMQEAQIEQDRMQKFALYGGLFIVILFSGFIYNRFKVTQKQKLIIEKQKEIVDQKNHIIEEKQNEIISSINYAKRIQNAHLPTERYIQRNLKNTKS